MTSSSGRIFANVKDQSRWTSVIVWRTRHTESGKNKNTRGVKNKRITQEMLTRLPTHAICSEMHFENWSAPEPVAAEKPSVWSFKHKQLMKEDEDWVFL